MGIKDANNMGAAMAPAFCETLITHFLDTGRSPNYYDSIISGDLGQILIDKTKLTPAKILVAFVTTGCI